jgi:hypothetical protein
MAEAWDTTGGTTTGEALQNGTPQDWMLTTWKGIMDIGSKVVDNLTEQQRQQQAAAATTTTSGISTKTIVLVAVGAIALIFLLKKV